MNKHRIKIFVLRFFKTYFVGIFKLKLCTGISFLVSTIKNEKSKKLEKKFQIFFVLFCFCFKKPWIRTRNPDPDPH